MAGRRSRGEVCAGTALRAPLPLPPGTLRGERQQELRQRIMDAALHACGVWGYRDLSVQNVLDTYGGSRAQFYRQFADKAECYAAAYEDGIADLLGRLRGACAAEQGWRNRLQAALLALARFLEDDHERARGLLIEVFVAGGPALAKREEVFERLTHAIDGARRETGSRHSPPPVTATFMLGAIESSVSSALFKRRPQAFAAAVPDLVDMAARAYDVA